MADEKTEYVIYTAYFKGYAALSSLHGRLFEVRRAYFEEPGKKVKGSLRETEDGMAVDFRYKMTRGGMKWEKRGGRAMLEKAYSQPGGYYILTNSRDGRLLSKSEYSDGHLWEKTTWCRESDGKPVAILSKPPQGGGELSLLQYDPQDDKYRRTALYPCPVRMGTAAQSVIDSIAGEPAIYTATSGGDFCWCGEEEHKRREALVREIENGGLKTEPEWNVGQNPGEPSAAPPQLPRKSEPVVAVQPQPLFVLNTDSEFMEKPAPEQESGQEPEQEKKSVPDGDGYSYSVNRELFHVDAAPPPQRYTVASKPIGGDVRASAALTRRESVPDASVPDTSVPDASAQGESVSKISVPDTPVSDESVPDTSVSDISMRESAPAELFPAKNIVISASESYRYFGGVLNGLRHGRGRTETPAGMTAYEGDYFLDKREGFGTYYYSTGKICYVGDFKENLRHGVGVSFRPQDSSMHVGLWHNDAPVGCGSVFDREGNLCYAGRLVDGQREGAGVSYRAADGTVFVGKWSGNRPTGEGCAFDPDGCLRYVGGWKDGMRHGMGTEYSPQGAVIFVGVWEKDKRKSGVLYENGVPKPYNLSNSSQNWEDAESPAGDRNSGKKFDIS